MGLFHTLSLTCAQCPGVQEDWEAYPAWLQPINATGVQCGDGIIDVQFLVNASKLSGAAGSVPVNVVNTFEGTPGRKLLQFNLDAHVNATLCISLDSGQKGHQMVELTALGAVLRCMDFRIRDMVGCTSNPTLGQMCFVYLFNGH